MSEFVALRNQKMPFEKNWKGIGLDLSEKVKSEFVALAGYICDVLLTASRANMRRMANDHTRS